MISSFKICAILVINGKIIGMKLTSKAFLVLVLYLFTINSFTTQAQQLPFATLKISDGLEDTVIFAIEQDELGFLWIATRTGINRFDGTQFWTYGQKDGLPHNLGRDLYKSQDGTLWVASERGLAWFDGIKFQTLSDWPKNTTSRAISEADDGTLWVATYGSGLLHIQTGEHPKVIQILDFKSGMPSDRIRSVLVDRQGNIWAGLSNRIIQINKGEIKNIKWQGEKSEVRTFYQHSDGTIWAGTRNGIYFYNGQSFEILKLDKDLSNQTVNTITRDNLNNIWIGTRDYGVYKIDKNLSSIHMDIKDGLPDNSVNSIFQDSENNIWYGTYGGGIARLSTSKVLNWKAQPGFPNPNVYSIAHDKKGCMWFSTNGNGVSKLCQNKFTHITRNDGLLHNKVLSVIIDKNDEPWFGTLDGISHFHTNGINNFDESDGLGGSVIYQIIQKENNSFWIGTNNGLHFFNGHKFTQYNKMNGLPDNRINRIYENSNNELWIATANGLANYSNGKFKNWATDDGLPANFINDLYEDKSGGLWIATTNGLSYFKDGVFNNWSTIEGLPHNNCTVLLPSKDGKIWVGTSRGVAIFDGKNFTVITSREGLVYDLINRGAGYRDNEDNLWFGTGEGVSQFASDFKPGSTTPPPIQLISVSNNQQLLPLKKQAKIHQKDSSMQFNFSGISFQRAPDVNYRYRLNKGPESQWRETRLNELQIDSLATGDYMFEVTARIGQGEWNRHPATFPFKIIPPFWKTYWFMSLIFAIILAIFLYRNYKIKQYSSRLEHQVKKRTKELEKVNKGLEWMANYDNLTKLANRNNVREILENTPKSDTGKLGILIIDLDFFKAVNDNYGHMAGDIALKQFANMLTNTTNNHQIAARWGGEEFLVVCKQTDSVSLQKLASNILKNCRKLKISLDEGTSFSIRCSIGFALSQPNNPDWNKTIQLADLALYSAKHGGRDCAIGYLWNKKLPQDWNFSYLIKHYQEALNEKMLIVIKI